MIHLIIEVLPSSAVVCLYRNDCADERTRWLSMLRFTRLRDTGRTFRLQKDIRM
uniref:PH domain-containing protein n=1 Tax=Ascaris lumbricoides TaxID=6252 RepID=A0A0M3IGI7_ASCLU